MHRLRHAIAMAAVVCVALLPTGCDPLSGGGAAQGKHASQTTKKAREAAAKKKKVVEKTRTELRRGLLRSDDVAARAKRSAAGVTGTYSSTQPGCRQLVGLLNTRQPRGAVASVARSWAGGEQGPFVDQRLHRMRSQARASAYVAQYAQALRSCDQVSVDYPGSPRSVLGVLPAATDAAGNSEVVLRFHGEQGGLDGFDFDRVESAAGGTVIELTLAATKPKDVRRLSDDAVRRVRASLDRKSS